MIELRWLMRAVPDPHTICDGLLTGHERVLQYRLMKEINDQHRTGYYPCSDWMDVPIVQESHAD